MGLERLRIGVRVRTFMVMSVKTCYRSVWNHPFLVGLVCFLIFLYRSFPLLFSVLVTASPVLVCTAILLGTLLSFGSPNIPEIDEKEEEQVSNEVSPLKTGVTKDNTVVERDAGDADFVVERHGGKRWDTVESADEKVSLVDNGVGKRWDTAENADEKVSLVDNEVGKRWDTVENADEKVALVDNEVSEVEDDSSVQYNPLVNEDLDSRDIHCENGVIDEVEGTLNDLLVEKKREIQEEMLASDLLVEKKREILKETVGSEGGLSMGQAVKDKHLLANEVVDTNFKVEDGKLAVDSGDMTMGDELDASLLSSWKRFGHDADEGEGDDDDDDESLDSGSDGAESSSPDASMADIMPMLDELHPLLGMEVTQPSQMSHDGSDASSERSHGSSNDESVESGELENHVEEDNDGEEDEDEGEGAKGNKEDESKSAIKWTEDDQKNLMDLGTSELERNQRLENLIARRRDRKSMRLMAEKNLIDLDGADIPLNIAPISTTRRNPFDLPYGSSDDIGLPPIPGSAPSILQPRRNPFDLPYDSSEEKPDLKGDIFEEEFSGFNQRETVTQREAFFQRHQSFNVGPSSLSVPRQELKWKPYFVPERLVTEGASPSSFQRQSSEVSESKLSSVPDTESVSSVVDEEDNNPNEHDVSQVTELNLNGDHASVHDEQGSQSSGDVESVDVEQAENRDIRHDVVEITLGDGESQLEMESSFSEAGATIQAELNASEFQPRTEPVEEDYDSRSSLSSSSGMDEKISDVKAEESAGFEARYRDIKESGISTQTSFEESDFHFTNRMVDDNRHREPVYDTSPTSIRKFLSSSSISSDTPAEISEMGSPPMLAESTDKELEGLGETTEQGTHSFEVMHASSSDLLNENEPMAKDLPKVCEPNPIHAGSSGVSSASADHNVSAVPESVVEYLSEDEESSSSDKGLVENVPNKEESFNQDRVESSSLGAETDPGVDQGLGEVLGSSPEEQQHAMLVNEFLEAETVEKYAVDKEETQRVQDEIHSSSSSEDNVVEGTFMPKEEIIQTECDQIRSSYSDANLDADGQHDKGEELSSTALSYQDRPSPNVTLTPEELTHLLMVQVSQVHPPEADTGEEHEKESEMCQVQTPCSDTKIDDTGLSSDINVVGISSNSSYQDAPSREYSSPESEKEVSWSDAAAYESPIHDNDMVEEPYIIASKSGGEVNIVNTDVKAFEVHDSEDKLSTNFSSMTSESTSYPVESPELRLPTNQEDMKYNFLNEIESEGPKKMPEHFKYAAEANATHVDEENVSEEVDEIKEIDEGILSELDTVGDFSAKDIGLSERSHVGYTEPATLPEDIKTEANVELPVLEARSVEDINLAFKQLHEGVDVEELILPSMIENQQDHDVTNSKLPVVEARSLEDIHSALQKVLKSDPAELPHSLDLGNASSEVEGHDVASAKEIEVNNVVSGIQENSENAAGEPKNEDRHDLVSTKEIEVSNVAFGIHENRDNGDGEPENEERHHVVSTKETEDGNGVSGENAAGEQTNEEGHDVVSTEEIEVSNLLSGIQEDRVHDVGELKNEEGHSVVSTKEIEVTNVVAGIQENSENAAGETKHEYEEASEKSSKSISNHKGKKAKSHDSSSSSSSSDSE